MTTPSAVWMCSFLRSALDEVDLEGRHGLDLSVAAHDKGAVSRRPQVLARLLEGIVQIVLVKRLHKKVDVRRSIGLRGPQGVLPHIDDLGLAFCREVPEHEVYTARQTPPGGRRRRGRPARRRSPGCPMPPRAQAAPRSPSVSHVTDGEFRSVGTPFYSRLEGFDAPLVTSGYYDLEHASHLRKLRKGRTSTWKDSISDIAKKPAPPRIFCCPLRTKPP